MFALTFLGLIGWAGYNLVKMMWENKSTIARMALAIYNLPETAYQTFTRRQKNI
jgi:TRAP-type C4-dicarboxylate transport system permease small subunit